MIRDFKSFNENSNDNTAKYLAIAESLYNDLHDIMINVPDIKYCTYLIESRSEEGKTFYCVNSVLNDYPHNEDVVKRLGELRKEYISHYNDNQLIVDFSSTGTVRKYGKFDNIISYFGDDYVSKRIDRSYLDELSEKLMDISTSFIKLENFIKSNKDSKLNIDNFISSEYYNKKFIIEAIDKINKYKKDNL